MKSLLIAIKDVLVWNHARGTWPYDILCLLIVLAVFLVPSRYFGDRDRPAVYLHHARRPLADERGLLKLEVSSDELSPFLASPATGKAVGTAGDPLVVACSSYVRQLINREVTIERVESWPDTEGRLRYRILFKMLV